VALTADTMPQQVVACRKAGMDGHIAKPVDYITLIQRVDDATAIVSSSPDIATIPDAPVPDAPVPDAPVPDAGLTKPRSRLDHAVLQRTLAVLPPDRIKPNLQLLRGVMQTMLNSLDHPDNLAQQLGAAHMLTAAAGQFGFTALSSLARSLDHALEHSALEADALIQQIRPETQAALQELDALMHELMAEPA
jgi:CheY-like chemotaxis protein